MMLSILEPIKLRVPSTNELATPGLQLRISVTALFGILCTSGHRCWTTRFVWPSFADVNLFFPVYLFLFNYDLLDNICFEFSCLITRCSFCLIFSIRWVWIFFVFCFFVWFCLTITHMVYRFVYRYKPILRWISFGIYTDIFCQITYHLLKFEGKIFWIWYFYHTLGIFYM